LVAQTPTLRLAESKDCRAATNQQPEQRASASQQMPGVLRNRSVIVGM
jgi:hypothetical protein